VVKLSVVILNYKVRDFLEQCLLSLERALQQVDAEIIVVDNASDDGSLEMVRAKFPQVFCIANEENLGFSKGNNIGIAHANGEYICLLNPDTAVSEQSMREALAYLDAHPDMGGLGLRLMDGTGHFLPESKRNLPTPRVAFSKLFGFWGKGAYYHTSLGQFESGEVPVLVGACFFVRKDRYLEVGGLDEDYFMYGEDIDLSYKLTKAGYPNHYLGNVTVLHYKGESTVRDKTYKRRFYGAMELFFKKHYSSHPLAITVIRLGLWMSRLRPAKGRGGVVQQPEEALLFSENLRLLKQLKSTLETPLRTVSKSTLSHEPYRGKLMIFDLAYLTYSQVFSVMYQLRGQGNTFRMIPAGADSFMIGSDHSDSRGSVTHF
jgi:GT2 family glycosyltransferase